MNADGLAGPTARRLGFLLIVIGVLLALDTFLNLAVVYRLWPVLIGMVGIGLIGIFFKGNSRVPMFLAAGVYLVCFSGLALFCSFTSWATMASLWPLFVTFLGVVFVALSFYRERRPAYLLTGLLLVSLSAVFSVTLTFGANWWWTVFILVGLSVLIAEKAK
jgi:hypothetical protein